MLFLKNLKPKKSLKNKINVLKKKNVKFNNIVFGEYGLKLKNTALLTYEQIEATRRAISRNIPKTCRVWINGFAGFVKTQKAKETRMGKGKGKISHLVYRAFKGHVLFEIGFIEYEVAKLVLKYASKKLPVQTVFVKKRFNVNVIDFKKK